MNRMLSKWRRMSAPAKASIAFIFSSFILKGINFLTTPFFTRFMEASEYGVLSTYNSWISIIDVFACFGLTSAGVINVGLNEHQEPRERKMYLSSMTGLCNLLTVIVFGLLFFIQKYGGHPIRISGTLLTVMFLHQFFSPALVFWTTAEKYEYKYRVTVAVTVLSVLLGTVSSLIAVSIYSSNLGTVKIIYQEIGNACFYLPVFVYVLWTGRKYVDIKLWKKTLAFAAPLIPHFLSQHIMTSIDRIMIADMVSSSTAGIYSVVVTINALALIFWWAIEASLMPFTFRSLNKKDVNGLSGAMNVILTGYAVICLAVTLIAPEILRVLGPDEYQNGIYAVPPLICAAFLSAVYHLYSNVEFYYKKSGKIASATVAAAVANVVLNYILIPRFGFIAAAYTTMISNIVLAAMHFLAYRRITEFRIYDDRMLLLILICCVSACLCCSLLYADPWFRYGTVLLILLIVVFMRKQILLAIHSMRNKG